MMGWFLGIGIFCAHLAYNELTSKFSIGNADLETYSHLSPPRVGECD